VEAEFFELAQRLAQQVRGDEVLTLWFAGERSDFVRFNQGKVRQPGSVAQRRLQLRLISAGRQVTTNLSLSGTAWDISMCATTIETSREILKDLPVDPYLDYAREVRNTQTRRSANLPSADEIVNQIVRCADGRDLVGIYAAGSTYRGFANSLGQRNWHETASFNFEWSLYDRGDKAVKSGYAGVEWDAAQLQQSMDSAAQQLALLRLPARRIAAAQYRAYLAPRALDELLGLLGWGGFSAKSRAIKRSPLLRMQEGQRLHAAVTLREHTAAGVAPGFQSDGYLKPPSITLIDRGALGDALVAPRTAKEYGLLCNGASSAESPQSMEMAAGDLPAAQVLSALDTGLYINNLWYLNFSDRAAGRCTGMTRFACFWVEQGKIVAPLDVMRFDDSIYRMLGSQLVALTREREFLLDPSTYGERSSASSHLPGALIDGLMLTL
jgi:predicted Zn-dependent protease